ncbi:DMT family transporter [Piscinibacter sp.]|jgi:S-adenosylmethionine uptake transporter|uniref:DMT family transporter n=1 Tax=Piscinibacter sp. TaxID=1903157 RepID=UPI002F4121B5
MAAPWLMVLASLLFATMGVCVKLASTQYGSAEIVFYRSLTGALIIAAFARWQGGSLRTRVPAMHFWRSATGVTALCLWFYAIGGLPLATAMTLNYMSSVWMALFLVGAAVVLGSSRVDGRLIGAVLLGFAGVGLILQPTIEQNQWGYGLIGLLSGMVSAGAYLQISALGRCGEPDYRVVFYFSLGGIVAGAAITSAAGWHRHTPQGLALLLATGLLATVAQLLMTRAYGRGGTLVIASLQYLGIAFSFGYGVLLFDDRVTWPAVAGMVLIIGAGLAATLLRSLAPTKS